MSTKTTWSETANWLAFNVVAGLQFNSFYCPIFGTEHKIPEPRRDIAGARGLRIFNYRGYSYFIKEVFNTERSQYYYMFGLYVPPRQGGMGEGALCNIVMISKKMDHAIFFDTSGRVIDQTHGHPNDAYAMTGL